jgi:lactate racemase
MMADDYYLCVGKDKKHYFSLPAGWVPIQYARDAEEAQAAPAQQMAAEALALPVKTQPLKDLVKRGQKVAIIIDDGTRPTPVSAVLEALFPCLEACGLPAEDIAIVVALGTHVPMTDEALESRLGRDVIARYRLVQHNAWGDNLVPVSLPGGDQVVKVNPEVAKADFVIGISSILPHPMAGYGGGPKIVMPGVCNFEYIRDHHMKYTISPHALAGKAKGNPFHEGCMKVAKAVGLDFSINCVYNQQGELVRILGGSLENAFAAAEEECFQRLGAKFEEKVDVTITSTYPHTHAHQFCKGLSAPCVVTKETGAILLVAPMVTPVPDEFLSSFDLVRERSDNRPAAYARQEMSKGLPFLPDKPLEFNMAMSTVLLRPSTRIILVSPLVSEAQAQTMGFEYAPSVEEGIAMLEKAFPEARAAIFPSGGLAVPIVSWKE